MWRKLRRALKDLVLGFLPLILFAAFILRASHEDAAARPAAVSSSTPTPDKLAYREVQFDFGRGYIGDGWRLYFSQPDASVGREGYAGGLDQVLAEAIQQARHSLDIAAFEMNSEPIVQALLEAQARGLRTRIVADDDHGLDDKSDDALRRLQAAGIPVVDDDRSGLMHNKFMILDGRSVWTGSLNYTVNSVYRNNNNVFVIESAALASAYQAEFDEMFQRGEFGARSTDDGFFTVALDEGEVSVLFAAEADEVRALTAEIERSRRSIHFMTFVFSLEALAEAMLLQAARADLNLRGVFERRGSTASWSQLPALHCAGARVRRDGNRYAMHHKVIIIDETTVVTGSFNFSQSAAKNNDENIVIIRHAPIAGLYLDEWRRIWDSALEVPPHVATCD